MTTSKMPIFRTKRKARAEFGERFHASRVDSGITQQKVAESIGCSKQLVSHWENGRSEITVSDAVRVAHLFKCDLVWLLTGSRSQGHELPHGIYAVPMLTIPQLVAFAAGNQDVTVSPKTGTNLSMADLLSFHVADHSMEPAIMRGDTLIVDCRADPEPGDCVAVALLVTREFLFRRYKPRPGARKAHFTLIADNPMYDPREIRPADRAVVLGTMCQHISTRSR